MSGKPLEPNLLQLLAESVPHRIYAKDCDGRFTFANNAVAIGMGVGEPAALIGKTDFDFYPLEAATRYCEEEQQVLRLGKPMLNHEERVDYLLLGEQAWLMTTKIPLRDAGGHVVGLVGINYEITRRKLAEDALRVANSLAEKTAQELAQMVGRLRQEVSERQRMEVELRRRALYDDLTGLPNRFLLMDRLDLSIKQAQRSGELVTLLFLDLDDFKRVNDRLGHAVGDKLLIAIAQRIACCLRQSDTLARPGGDEFVMVLPNTIDDEDLSRLTERIATEVARPLALGDHSVSINCSVGCASFPRDGGDGVTLLQYADAEMYRVKQQHRRDWVHLPGEQAKHLEEDPKELALQLRHALRRHEFKLQYQPQVDLQSGRVVGVEALVRWLHPDRGLVSPLRFIPIAEQCGEIGRIGEWVLREACAQAMQWQRAGFEPLRMSVNLSALQFTDPGLEALVTRVLSDSGLAPQYLELELTESVSMRDPEESIRILGRFHSMGIGLAIDDFGTGYSNLASLLNFPVDRVKLDRSFICELGGPSNCDAIVDSVISMMHRLGLQVVAEGVETEQQRDLLKGFGCDTMQGYWFSRPVDAQECEKLMTRCCSARPLAAQRPFTDPADGASLLCKTCWPSDVS